MKAILALSFAICMTVAATAQCDENRAWLPKLLATEDDTSAKTSAAEIFDFPISKALGNDALARKRHGLNVLWGDHDDVPWYHGMMIAGE